MRLFFNGCEYEGAPISAVLVLLADVVGVGLEVSIEDEDEALFGVLLEVLLVVSLVVTSGGPPCDPVVIALTYPVCNERPVAEQ